MVLGPAKIGHTLIRISCDFQLESCFRGILLSARNSYQGELVDVVLKRLITEFFKTWDFNLEIKTRPIRLKTFEFIHLKQVLTKNIYKFVVSYCVIKRETRKSNERLSGRRNDRNREKHSSIGISIESIWIHLEVSFDSVSIVALVRSDQSRV